MMKRNQLIRHVNMHAQRLKALVDPRRVVYALNWSCRVSDVGFAMESFQYLVTQCTLSLRIRCSNDVFVCASVRRTAGVCDQI